MTTTTTTANDIQTNEIEFVSDALIATQKLLVNQKFSRSVKLRTAKLYPCLQTAIRDMEKFLSIPHQEFFLSAIFSKGQYKSLRHLELALVEGEPAFVLDGQVFNADILFDKKHAKEINYVKSGDAKENSFALWLSLNIDNEDVINLPIKVSVSNDVATDGVKLKKSKEIFKEHVHEYIFGNNILKEGEHAVTKLLNVNNKLLAAEINKRFYYVPGYVFEQLETREKDGHDMVLVIETERDFTNANGETYKKRPLYAKGFAPAMSFISVMRKYREFPETPAEIKNNKELKGVFPLKEPLTIEILGLDTTTTKDGEEKEIIVGKVGEDIFRFYPNSGLKKGIALGRFDVTTFENFTIVVNCIKPYNEYFSIAFEWNVPVTSIPRDETLEALENDILACF